MAIGSEQYRAAITHISVFPTRVCSIAGGVRQGDGSLAVHNLSVRCVGDDKVHGRKLCKQESFFGMWGITALLTCQAVREGRPHSYTSLHCYACTFFLCSIYSLV